MFAAMRAERKETSPNDNLIIEQAESFVIATTITEW